MKPASPSKMCNDSPTLERPTSLRASVSGVRPFFRRRSFSRPSARREVSCVDEDATKRHSQCSNESLDSGVDMSPPATVRSHGSPLRSSLRSPGVTSPKKKTSISFHPQVLVWTSVQNGNFDELFDVLIEHCSVPKSGPAKAGTTEDRPSVDLNRTNHQGITLLHLCCFAGSAKCVRLLLALGANPTRYDDDGWTPLHAAAVGGHDEVIQMLAAAGADISCVDVFGRRPCDVAGNDVTRALLQFLAAQGNVVDNASSPSSDSAADKRASQSSRSTAV